MGMSNFAPLSDTSGSSGQPSGGKGNVTTPATSAQPSFGQPNQYPNTVGGGWDNASLGNQATGQQSGKGGKGQSNWQPYSGTWTPPASVSDQATQPGTQPSGFNDVGSAG